jgi:phage shock protein PspC (stress-responsive transcriptional regulator)
MQSGFIGLVWIVTSIGTALFNLIILIIAWRLMRAHEKVAENLKK